MPVRITRRNNRGRNLQNMAGLFLVLVAIVLAGFMFRTGQGPINTTVVTNPVVGEFDTVSLPVPADPVPPGTRVQAIKFKYVSFPRHQVPMGALRDLNPILGGTTIAMLPANIPLFQENFSLTGVMNPVTEKIPAGMRAMTIKVDATSAVEGWAGSGTVVDVLLVEGDRSAVVAERVKILSAERKVSPVEGAASPNIPTTVTLLVTQEQCLAINTAIPRGRIAFALRNNKDDEQWVDTVYTADRLKGGSVSENRSVVTGFAEVKNSDGSHTFALANGRWVNTKTVPDGILVSRRPGMEEPVETARGMFAEPPVEAVAEETTEAAKISE